MNKEIKYNGYSAVPSDYESPDGDLAISLNLIHENGALCPIMPPKEILKLSSPGERIVLIHSVPGQKNYIILREDKTAGSFAVYWLLKDPSVTDTDDAEKIGDFNGFRDIAIVGNTLVIATDEGIRYALWKNGDYITLQDKPPFISIDFGMCRLQTLSDSAQYEIPQPCSPHWHGRGSASAAQLASFADMVYGLLNPAITTGITTQGYFYQPFFVRYAYRLYDGTYQWHSAPILMLPYVLPPFIRYSDGADTLSDPDGTVSARLQIDVNYYALAYRILADRLDRLTDWTDIVSGIDVFISAPIYTYDQSKAFDKRPVTTVRSMLAGCCTSDSSSIFIGRWGVGETGDESLHIDHTMSTADNSYIVDIKPHEHFHDHIRDCHDFYKIAEFELKDIKAMSSMQFLPLKESNLSSLVSRETLSDDYQSHCSIIPSSLYVYNSRLNLAGVKIRPAEPFPLRSCSQFGHPDGAIATGVNITVWTRINGVKCYTVHSGGDGVADIVYNLAENFPRYIFYPDSSAYKMEVSVSDGLKFTINLVPHDFLNGAYYYKSDFLPDSAPENAEPESAICASSVSVGSKIYTSEVNNPFYFPAIGINTIGTGNIFALSSVVKALSQGQFGQFPLYAFSTDGVWAMEVASTGGLISRQPVTRDVCTNPDSITQIDSAVLFTTDRGIMLIQGSDSVCISDSLNADIVSSVSDIPSGDKLLGLASDIDVMPFAEFLKTCRMVYDYPHQRIIVYRPDTKYAYVYSLKSKAWGMMKNNISDSFTSYPEALAVSSEKQPDETNSDALVDFSQSVIGSINCILLTRPLKLNATDVLKTVDTVIQRGNFRKGHIQSVLYGSRNLYDWSLVWSSRDHFLRGFRGSPYKYFRIALICNLSPDESIYGASVQFTPRLTNQPR